MAKVPVSLACVSALGLGSILLGYNVSRNRLKLKESMGFGEPGSPLFNAIRAHGNFVEYSGILAALMIAAEHRAGKLPYTHWLSIIMIGATVSRFLCAFGIMFQGQKSHRGRFWGALGTYVFGTLLSAGILFVKEQ
eukprot:TRINITY_DN1722_c0_g1_i1.p1 TRINITY_DN1722_c0_g1~~TRINITY_DN1722_c0_g1_i1.p1  ORF type:complete len:136 (-),score=10.61 TRINITY_DN1722_c0_g1_i1:3-410(-)